MSILRSGEMLPRTEKRSGGTLRLEEERLLCGEEVGWRGREELLTGSESGKEALRLPEREEVLLKGGFERVIGMIFSNNYVVTESLYCFLLELMDDGERKTIILPKRPGTSD
jgi:hypothetical protein